MHHITSARPRWIVGLLALAAVAQIAAGPLGAQTRYKQHNLVSDIPGLADFTDPDLVNPWGISYGPSSPFWIANNHTGTSTLYNTLGVKQGLVVTIPSAGAPPGAPTGTVFNNAGAFALSPTHNATFLFASEDGIISGWNPAVSATNAVIAVNNSPSKAVYKGLAISGFGATARLYGANFHAGTVDVWDGAFAQVFGGFVDPTLPSGYAPFNVQSIGSSIYVTYALQGADAVDDVPGAGHGFVDEYDPAGTFLRRFASGGVLNSPWGLTTAPSTFGSFAGDLLIGNFGDGRINAFDPLSGAFQGFLTGANGNPVTIPGLWALKPGNGGNGGDPNLVYFTAGIPGDDGQLEDHGLFGSLAPVATPEPDSLALLGTGLAFLLGGALRSRRRSA